jgi:phage terminase large subunit-like protein
VSDPLTIDVRFSTFQNADNLAPQFLANIKSLYEGTRLGRQEIYGEILDDNPFALWTHATIDASRVSTIKGLHLSRVVVGVDPAVSYTAGSDLTGIVVAGISDAGAYYILGDYTMSGSPLQWAGRVVRAYHEHQADRIIGEVNNGGDLIETVIRQVDSKVSYRKVTASRGKALRAEPIAALYEQGKVHHVGSMPDLEDQMCEWVPNEAGQKSPDRMDALVWALTDLVENNGGPNRFGIMPASRS